MRIIEREYWEVFRNQSGNAKAEIAQKIINSVRDKCDKLWIGGSGVESGYGHSMIPFSSRKFGERTWDILPFSIWTNGTIEVSFQHYTNRPPFDSLAYKQKLADRLNGIEGVNIPKEKLSKRPSFNIENLEKEKDLAIFIDAFQWFYDQYGEQDQKGL